MNDDAIVFEGVFKHYEGYPRPAVEDVSLKVSRGDVVVILGTSGAGKTTLLKMVNRLIEPTAGVILVEGREVHSMPPNDLRRSIGYVIQQIGLFPHRTVAQNVATVPRLLGWEKARTTARCRELLEMLGLPPEEFAGRYPAQLSGGQQQRVGIARAMAADPDIFLMDEPFGALDAITRGGMQEELLGLQEKAQKTILFVTHDVDEAVTLADRIVVMRDGRVEQYDTPLEIMARPANEFVAELVGTDDIMKLLGLLSVREVMRPYECGEAEGPHLHPGDSLRRALGLMLRSGRELLAVVDQSGRPAGCCRFSDLKAKMVSMEGT